MPTTLQELIRRVALNTGGYYESTTTSDGSAATDIPDTALADESPDSNAFRSAWLQILDGQDAGEIRRVSKGTTAGLTIRATSNTTLNGTRYALYRYAPRDIIDAVNQAMSQTYDALYHLIVDESIIIDDLSKNGSFDRSRTALLFDNTDDNVSVSANATINDIASAGFTWSCWLFPFSDGEDTAGLILDKMGSDNKGWRVHLVTQVGDFMGYTYRHGYASTVGSWQTAENVVQVNRWNFLAGVHNAGATGGATGIGNKPVLYHAFEGGPLRSLAMSEGNTPVGNNEVETNALLFGNNNGDTATFDGLIADIQLWDKMRTQQVISEYMTKENIYPQSEPDLKGWWLTERETGASAIDASMNANDGSITGALRYEAPLYWVPAETDPTSVIRGRNLNDLIHGSQAIVVTAASGGVHQLRQFIDTQTASGTVVKHKRWVRADAGTAARIGIGGTSGVTTAFSDYHTGDAQWQLLSLEYTLTDDDIDVYILVEAAASQVGYFGMGWASIDKLYRYALPAGMRRPAYVSMQNVQERPTGEFVPLNDTNPQTGRLLRLEGKRPLETLEGLSDVTPLGPPHDMVLVEKASEILLRMAAARMSGDSRQNLLDNADIHQETYEGMIANPHQRMQRLGAEVGKNWRVEGDMLILEGANVGPVLSNGLTGVRRTANLVSPGTS